MRKTLALLAVSALCVTLTACDDDGRTAEETARAYVAALNARDRDALLALAKEDDQLAGREKDAEATIAKDGGRGLQVTGLEITTPTAPDYANVDITGTDKNGSPFKLAISVSREGGASDWTITLGRYEGIPEPPAATSR